MSGEGSGSVPTAGSLRYTVGGDHPWQCPPQPKVTSSPPGSVAVASKRSTFTPTGPVGIERSDTVGAALRTVTSTEMAVHPPSSSQASIDTENTPSSP